MGFKGLVKNLLERAHSTFPECKDLANRYVDLAIKYSQRAKVRIPKDWKRRICRHCKRFLYPGINCRVRIQSRKKRGSHLTITCLECHESSRYFLNTKK
ncbi:MAG: ribonuclease P [Candidatus Lokiarchaeota archaeon]